MALQDVWQEDYNWHDRMGELVYSSEDEYNNWDDIDLTEEDDWSDEYGEWDDEWHDYNNYWINE